LYADLNQKPVDGSRAKGVPLAGVDPHPELQHA